MSEAYTTEKRGCRRLWEITDIGVCAQFAAQQGVSGVQECGHAEPLRQSSLCRLLLLTQQVVSASRPTTIGAVGSFYPAPHSSHRLVHQHDEAGRDRTTDDSMYRPGRQQKRYATN